MNPLVLLLAAGAVLALGGRKRAMPLCMWSQEYRGYCYDTHTELFVTRRFGFHVTAPSGEGVLFRSEPAYPNESSAAQAARAWIDYHLDG